MFLYYQCYECPDMEGIQFAVASSTMVNKLIQWCRWDKNTEHLCIMFATELDEADQNKLDVIVSNNLHM